MSKIKRCKLTRIVPHHKPGSVLSIWGHQWTVQPDHTAIAMIHRDFHEAEVAAGRYIVLPDKPSPSNTKELQKFSNNADDYYGCKNIETLKKNLLKLDQPALIAFAESRISITFPTSMQPDVIVDEIINLISLKEKPDDTKDEPDIEDSSDEPETEETNDNKISADRIRLNLEKLKKQSEDQPANKRGPGRPKKN